MLKRMFIVLLAAAAVSGFAKSAIRIDVSGVKNKIAISPGDCSKDLTVTNAAWMGEKKQYYIMAKSGMNVPDKWAKYQFCFVPQGDGIVLIHFRGVSYKPKGKDKVIPVWVAYDNIKVTGTEAKNSNFEFVDQKNLFDGWTGSAKNMVIGAEDAQSGKNYVITWLKNPIAQSLKVVKGRKVTISFYAKASDGPAELKKKKKRK